MSRCFLCLFLLLVCAITVAFSEEPIDVTVCQLKSDPPAYSHKVVALSGFVSHAFEDFTISDPICSAWPDIWLEYGGTSKSGTMYCCGVTDDRERPQELVIEGVTIPLLQDETFQAFDKAIQPPFRSGKQGAIIKATLIGTFFAGKRIEYFKGKSWGGYGHMGCCTLLAIQQVKWVDTENRADLDYGASIDQPDISKNGCGYSDLLPIDETAALVQWQKDADVGGRDWVFDSPKQVASEALATATRLDLTLVTHWRLTREAPGRKVYEVRSSKKRDRYMVVVGRPYLSSFYSRDPKRVAWAPLAVYRLSCE